jgi:hypothetical protein
MLGGIIYFVNRLPMGETNVKLKNVVEYGMFTIGQWSAKAESAPFCEIVTERAILTFPSNYVPSIPDIPQFSERFDFLISSVVNFCAGELDRVLRFVFDIQLPGHNPVIANPIFLEYDYFAPLVLDEEPSSALLSVLISIGMLSFSPGFFSENDQNSLAMVAALLAFRAIWNDVSLLDEVLDVAVDVQEFWKMVAELDDPSVVTQAIKNLKVGEEKPHLELWNALLSELDSLTGKEFSRLQCESSNSANPDDVTM